MNAKSLLRTAALTCCVTAACAPGTGGALVDIELAVVMEGQGKQPPGHFDTRTGYTVELDEATLSVQSIFVYAPDPNKGFSVSNLWSGRALAHGGFDPFNGRVVRMEMSEPVELDLLAAKTVSLGSVQAEAGEMDSASVVFGDDVQGMTGQAYLRGHASRDGEEWSFEGRLQLEDQALLRRVDGVDAPGDLAAGGTLELRIRPHVLFDEAHFERLSANGAGVAKVTPETQVHTSWVFGARSVQAYGIKWRKP